MARRVRSVGERHEEFPSDEDDEEESTRFPSSAPLAPFNAPLDVGADMAAILARERTLYADDDVLKEQAAELLSAGHSAHAVARVLGLRPATVWSWVDDPAVRAAMRRGVEYQRAVVMSTLLDGAVRGAEALRAIAADPEGSSEMRIEASKELLDRTGFAAAGGRDKPVTVDVSFVGRLDKVIEDRGGEGKD